MISKKDNLQEITNNFPETSIVLSEFGLQCVGCHASAFESIEDGCIAHGLSEKKIDELIVALNKQVKLFDDLNDIEFTELALTVLKKKLVENKHKYVRLIPIFGGFDFDTVDKKTSLEVELQVGVPLLLNEKTKRFLKGIIVDFDLKQNDFVANRN